ncbi:hypothetical protein BDC45DRAFT_527018 [Circinella umbellata]|nr:hypothetical protein BDC45DRAFT_527018 [Circinella umbellata]
MTVNHIEKLQQLRSIFFEAFVKIDALSINDIERSVFDRATFLNQINSEILRLGDQMTIDDDSNNNNKNVDEIEDEQAAINMELELAEKAAAESLVVRRQEIASRFYRDVESLGASSLPVLHWNFGKRNTYTHFLSSNYTPQGCKYLICLIKYRRLTCVFYNYIRQAASRE